MPPPEPTSCIAQYIAVMGPSHYMQLVGVFQFAGGLLVLFGKTVPMGLVLLGPVLVNILAFHVFLDKGNGLGMGLVFCALEIFLIYGYRKYFLPIFTLNAKP